MQFCKNPNRPSVYINCKNSNRPSVYINCKLTPSPFSLFVLVTAEGWPDIDTKLNSMQPWSKVYIICFLFIGHFVFSNLFVAVIIGQIDRGKMH